MAAVVLGVLAPSLGAAPATAAAPSGSPTVPGIWNIHTVTFQVDGRTLSAVEVADGQHVPRQPAPTSPDGVFAGWFTTVGGVAVPFDVDTAVITSDLVVTARFVDTHVVQFLAAPSAGAPRVLDTDEVADGAALGEVAPDVPDVPAGQVFTGAWYVQGDASRTPYDFSTAVTEDLRLLPILRAGFAVSFITDGTAVEPVFVLEPDTALTAAELAAVPSPTRPGYTFTQWWADEARTQPIAFPITGTATLYAGWAGQSVGYDITYWLEKPNVVPDAYPAPVFTTAGGTPPAWGPGDGALSDAQLRDPANFDFLDDLPATATAGTRVGGPTDKSGIPASVRALVRAQLDPTGAQPDPLAFADLAVSQQNVTVQGDGSTVVNVYLTRALWRADFVLIAPGSSANVTVRCNPAASYDVRMVVGGTTYYQSTQPGGGQLLGTFSVRAKIGFDMQAAGVAPVPLSQTDGSGQITAYDAGTLNENCVLRGWGPQQVTPAVFTAIYTTTVADAGGVNLAARTTSATGKMAARSSQTLTKGLKYIETVDQTGTAPDQVLAPDGTPNNPLHVDTLYNNDKATVRAAIPSGHQIFEQHPSSWWYWASNGDRQVAGVLDGFTSYVGYNTGPNTQGNYFQLDQATNRLYQLNNSGNTNDAYRYQFYSRNAYDLTFVTNGGSPIPPATGIRYQSALAPYEPAAPTRGADQFIGWYADSDFNLPFTFTRAVMPASNLVLYAKWLTDPHTVRFYDDPSSAQPIDALTQTVQDQATASPPAPLPPRPDGSTFLGWYQRTADGYFVAYDFDTPVGSDLRLYARWQQPTASPFAVHYDGDGNTAGTVPTDGWRYNAGTSAIVADGSSLARADRVFVGWRLDLGQPAALRVAAPSTGPVDGLYQPGHTVPVGGADLTLVAVYANPNPLFTVTFHENGGPDRTAVWDGPPGASITYPDAADLAFIGPGSVFLGWSTSTTATTADPAFHRLTVSTLTADIALYAVWAPAPAPSPGPSTPAAARSGDLSDTGNDPSGMILLGSALLAVGISAALRPRRHSGRVRRSKVR